MLLPRDAFQEHHLSIQPAIYLSAMCTETLRVFSLKYEDYDVLLLKILRYLT